MSQWHDPARDAAVTAWSTGCASRTSDEVVLESFLADATLIAGRPHLRVDPLGLPHEIELGRAGSLLVRPRDPAARRRSSRTGGARWGSGRQAGAVRRPSGSRAHAVFANTSMASRCGHGALGLRRTPRPADGARARGARRGTAPRYCLIVDGAAEGGPPARSSLDEAVRAAGRLSFARSWSAHGRALRLVMRHLTGGGGIVVPSPRA